MQVLHISTYDLDGGASRAASRLHESLLKAGQKSTMLVKHRRWETPSVQEAGDGHNGVHVFSDVIQKWYVDQNRTPLSSTWFSAGWPGHDLSHHPQVRQADVIHLHWISGFVCLDSIIRLLNLGKPVVWTLHDQRPFTGGCHYASGCSKFEKDCVGCAQLAVDPCGLTAANLADQMQLGAHGGLTLIAPSRWMAECARRSAVFAKTRIEVIPCGIDIRRFRPIPQNDARKRLVLPKDDLLLLFGVDNSTEKRKGQRELYAALEACGRNAEFEKAAAQRKLSLLCFGDLRSIPELPIPVRPFGRVSSDETLSCIYSAADLFLLPSLEDNFPNTVLESLSCGTPVGAFGAGGVPEMIVEGETGFLASTGDVESLTGVIVNAVVNYEALRNMRTACRRSVERNFTYQRQAEAYTRLYCELLGRVKETGTQSAAAKNSVPGSHFKKIYPRLLKHALDNADGNLCLFNGSPANESHAIRRIQLPRRLKKIVKHAVDGSWPYRDVEAALEAELKIAEGHSVAPLRGSVWARRILGR